MLFSYIFKMMKALIFSLEFNGRVFFASVDMIPESELYFWIAWFKLLKNILYKQWSNTFSMITKIYGSIFW